MMSSSSTSTFRSALSSALILLTLSTVTVPASAAAPDAPIIEELIVQGEFRRPSLGKTPASVSVIQPEDSRQTLINHLEEVLNWVPNVNLSSGGSRARFIQIRGIGERGQFAEPLNSSVGLLVDGVDLSGIGTVAGLFDTAQVEVLRGPQGTLHGANALAGLINIATNDPEDTMRARVQADLGNFDARGIGAMVTGPVGEHTAFRLAGRLYQDDGFLDNRFLDEEDTNRRDELTLRGKLSFAPTDTFGSTLAIGHLDFDNGYDAFSLDNDRNTRSDEPGQDRQETTYASLISTWQASEHFSVQNTIGWATSDSDYSYDEDWTFTGFDPIGYTSTDRYERERDTVNVDLRLVSDTRLLNDRVDWVAGLYVLQQDVDLTRTYTFLPGPFSSRFEIDRVAIYGEATTHLSERTRVTTGLRFEQHESTYRDSEGVRFTPEDDLVGGRLLVEHDLNPQTLLYLALTRGYRAGGFNTSGTLDADLREFDPEYLWNYELGLKGRWLNDRLNVRAALFLMDRRDMQVATSLTRVRADNSAEFIDFIGNAAEGRNAGLEIEAAWYVTDQLRLFGSLGLLDTELENYTNGNGEDLDGRDQAQAPGYNFFVGAEYSFLSDWFARVELEGKDSYFLSDSHEERAPSYELINASVGYENERWAVRLWARNLTDEDYVVRGFFFGNDPRDFYTARGFNQLGEPRRVGLTANVFF
ncbi:MAG: TonB-dependent receptor [Pseudomonadota bacterium]